MDSSDATLVTAVSDVIASGSLQTTMETTISTTHFEAVTSRVISIDQTDLSTPTFTATSEFSEGLSNTVEESHGVSFTRSTIDLTTPSPNMTSNKPSTETSLSSNEPSMFVTTGPDVNIYPPIFSSTSFQGSTTSVEELSPRMSETAEPLSITTAFPTSEPQALSSGSINTVPSNTEVSEPLCVPNLIHISKYYQRLSD